MTGPSKIHRVQERFLLAQVDNQELPFEQRLAASQELSKLSAQWLRRQTRTDRMFRERKAREAQAQAPVPEPAKAEESELERKAKAELAELLKPETTIVEKVVEKIVTIAPTQAEIDRLVDQRYAEREAELQRFKQEKQDLLKEIMSSDYKTTGRETEIKTLLETKHDVRFCMSHGCQRQARVYGYKYCDLHYKNPSYEYGYTV